MDNTSNVEPGGLVLSKRVRNLGPAATPTSPIPALGLTSVGKPGDVLEYCIDAKNNNTQALAGVNVTDAIPANTTYTQFSTGSTGTPTGTPVTSVAFTPIASLASGATVQQCFQVTVN